MSLFSAKEASGSLYQYSAEDVRAAYIKIKRFQEDTKILREDIHKVCDDYWNTDTPYLFGLLTHKRYHEKEPYFGFCYAFFEMKIYDKKASQEVIKSWKRLNRLRSFDFDKMYSIVDCSGAENIFLSREDRVYIENTMEAINFFDREMLISLAKFLASYDPVKDRFNDSV